MKHVWIFIVVILLVGGVVFEEKHRAETVTKHFPQVTLTKQDPTEDAYLMKASNFSDQVDLWGNPWMEVDDSDLSYSRFTFNNDLNSASTDRFQSRSDHGTEPVLTIIDRQVAYALFEFGGLKLTLNFKPAYPNPEALLPTHIDPSITGSFSF